MSVVFAFVAVWVVVIVVWLSLDWLGNPNRGRFWPQGERLGRRRTARRDARSLRRDRRDVAVRTVLRDRFGRSSLRLRWSDDQELEAIGADEDLVTMSRSAAGLARFTAANAPAAPEVELYDGRADEPGESAPDEPEARRAPMPTAGWRVGGDPLSPTRRGTRPAAATVRSRVWKNQSDVEIWDDENRERLKAGKPPRRHNPVTGRSEQAIVDTETGTGSWPDPAIDPFAEADR